MLSETNGSIKWFNNEKGYGWIQIPGRDKDIFFHAKQWRACGLVGLPVEGEPLKFVIETGPKGDFATQISRIKKDA